MSTKPLLPVRLRVYGFLARFLARLSLLIILFALLAASLPGNAERANLYGKFQMALGLPILLGFPMLVFYFLWQKQATLHTFSVLPQDRTASLDVRSSWLLRRLNSLKQMRELWRIWISGIGTPWYVNAGFYWQIFFIIWLMIAKSSSKVLNRDVVAGLDPDIVRIVCYVLLVLSLLLTSLTITLTQKISRAMQQGTPAPARSNASRLPEMARPTKAPRTDATSRDQPRQQQDPVMWRRK